MTIHIQHIQLHLENRQAIVTFDDRDGSGNILSNGQVQFTLSESVRDTLFAESSDAITNKLVQVQTANLRSVIEKHDEALAETEGLKEEAKSIAAEIQASREEHNKLISDIEAKQAELAEVEKAVEAKK